MIGRPMCPVYVGSIYGDYRLDASVSTCNDALGIPIDSNACSLRFAVGLMGVLQGPSDLYNG